MQKPIRYETQNSRNKGIDSRGQEGKMGIAQKGSPPQLKTGGLMASKFTFLVEVEVEKTEGKFASRDELYEEIESALFEANPQEIDGVGVDGNSTYEVTIWEVR